MCKCCNMKLNNGVYYNIKITSEWGLIKRLCKDHAKDTKHNAKVLDPYKVDKYHSTWRRLSKLFVEYVDKREPDAAWPKEIVALWENGLQDGNMHHQRKGVGFFKPELHDSVISKIRDCVTKPLKATKVAGGCSGAFDGGDVLQKKVEYHTLKLFMNRLVFCYQVLFMFIIYHMMEERLQRIQEKD